MRATSSEAPSSTISDMARAIRSAVLEARSPEYLAPYLSIISPLLKETADQNHMIDFSVPDGSMTINSTFS
jgi:hypothetical protein